ncbi:ac transposable element-derived 3 [Brachionus plicatilis]|uniref:Ac transposable element-derived 3 n=1 Tax=Brachionus plicatilis TaxID=10195 RepID=A0A3M7QUX7_BRAPC|nr:ac transposable element-derived 3 [Brachionus plicatilis]
MRKLFKEYNSSDMTIIVRTNIILNPKNIMADFEKESTQAFMYHFPDAEVKGCWFHFRQAINRNIIRYRLKQHYNQVEFKKFINSLGALALLPLDKVQEGFENEPKTWTTNQTFELIITSKGIAIVDYSRFKQCQQIRKRPRKEEEKQFTLELIKIQHKDSQN